MSVYEMTVVCTVQADSEEDARTFLDDWIAWIPGGGSEEVASFTIRPGVELSEEEGWKD